MNEVEHGSKIEVDDEEYELKLVKKTSVGEAYISVFHELYNGEPTGQYTYQRVDVDSVTTLDHGLNEIEVITRLMDFMGEIL